MCCCHSAAPALQERFVELTSRIEELVNRNEELTNDNNQLRGKIKSLRKFEGMSDHDGHERN